MITWPESLITELAERRAIPFIGAGISASSLSFDKTAHPPTWRDFLVRGASKVPQASDRDEAVRLIREGRYLDAAQVVHDGLPPAEFSLFLKRELVAPRFQPSRLHEIILELDPKVVVTVNYDEIYDNLCRQGPAADGYTVSRPYDGNAVDAVRSTQRVVLKVHGCVSDPARIVLTRRQYFEARRTYQGYYALLDGLILTNTLLFLGCGMLNDPDVQLWLENANISAPSAHTHYALVGDDLHPAVKRALCDTHNLRLIEYEAGKHGLVVAALERLSDDVNSYRASRSLY